MLHAAGPSGTVETEDDEEEVVSEVAVEDLDRKPMPIGELGGELSSLLIS